MTQSLVLSLLGPDRPGIVDDVAEVIAAHGGNWEESRMARLGGQFAGILLITVTPEKAADLRAALKGLGKVGLHVTLAATDSGDIIGSGRVGADLVLVGQDHPGIVHEVSAALAALGVNVEDLETWVEPASMGGGSTFHAHAKLRLPEGVLHTDVSDRLEVIANDLMVDLTLDV